MADFHEPLISEDWATLIGTATWNFDKTTGYSFDNTTFTAGSIVLVDAGSNGVCTFPEFTPPAFTEWLTSASGVAGTASLYVSTNTEPTYVALPAAMSTISKRGDVATFKAEIPLGANSVSSLIVTYGMSFSTVNDVKDLTDIENENVTGVTITDAQIRSAIRYANARIKFMLKDWSNFYPNRYDTFMRSMLIQAEAYYCASIIFEQKAKQFLNLTSQGEGFSVSDLSITTDQAATKPWYIQYQNVADRYFKQANGIMRLIVPPGTEDLRTPFYFDTCKSVETVEDEAISDE